MSGLPQMLYKDGIKKTTQVKFYGYDHNLGAAEGSLWDMENMSAAHYPLLSTRERRTVTQKLNDPHALFAADGLFTVDGDGFFVSGERKGTVTPTEKVFCAMGAYVLIFPDKAYYRTDTDEFGSLEETYTGTVTVCDGTYNGESAAGNTLKLASGEWTFRVGDSVTLSGCTNEENNKTTVVEELSDDKRELRFLENCFTNESGTITVKREVPDLDYLCQNENRVWGCKGDTIYACALGNPFVWYDYRGLSTDSYAVDVGSAGDFTACCSYLGYPVFFKEEHIYKVYGSKPSNFQVMGSATLGVAQGSHNSLAIAGEKLYYLSRTGVTVYSGGTAGNVSSAFGGVTYRNAVAGSDGVRYYISMQNAAGEWHLFVYHPSSGLWVREDSTQALGFAWQGGLYCLSALGDLFLINPAENATGEPENAITSFVEFGDFIESNPNEKGVSRLHLRVELDEQAELTVLIRFDSEGDWHTVKTLHTDRKRSLVLPIVPRRCDHWRLRLEGTGSWRLYSMAREFYAGSDLQS